jgi:HAD superfamily hydrolase (TIGR01509 family)
LVKAVIFDLDGTLVDTNYLHVEAWARAFAAIGKTVPRTAIHKQVGKGGDKFLPEFVSDEAAAQRADALHGELYAAMQEYGYPLPGAKDLLAALKQRGVALWLGTSAKPEELERFITVLDAKDKLAGIISSDDVAESKPAADIFAVAARRAGVPPAEAVVVGDTIWDVESARRAGLRIVALLSGGAYSRAELAAAGACAVYDDCAALLAAGFPDDLPDANAG